MPEREVKFTWPKHTALSKSAFDIVRKLRDNGFAAYLAGGAVRDAILKRPVTDIDIATDAKPGQVQKLFPKNIPTGLKHGTVTVRQKNLNFEVTTFRSEGRYLDRRRPASVKFLKKADGDARRRDFTINALFFDPASKKIIDYTGGIEDLNKKTIRLVGDPNTRIKEDALRLLRAVRFATLLEFDLERETRRAIQKNAKLILQISAERIKQELDRIMASPRAAIGLGLMDVLGLLQYVLPEIKNMQGVSQPKNHHSEGDVYTHSLLALEKTDSTYDLITKYAVLLHDVGKAETREIRDGKITFYNHQNVGADIAENVAGRLKFSNADTAKLSWLIKNHMVPHDLPKMKLSTRRKWALNEHFPGLLKVYLADVRSSLRPTGRSEMNPPAYRLGLKILREISAKPILKKPILSGNEVMKILKVGEGPKVGHALKILEEKKLAGILKNKEQAEKFLRKLKKEKF